MYCVIIWHRLQANTKIPLYWKRRIKRFLLLLLTGLPGGKKIFFNIKRKELFFWILIFFPTELLNCIFSFLNYFFFIYSCCLVKMGKGKMSNCYNIFISNKHLCRNKTFISIPWIGITSSLLFYNFPRV